MAPAEWEMLIMLLTCRALPRTHLLARPILCIPSSTLHAVTLGVPEHSRWLWCKCKTASFKI